MDAIKAHLLSSTIFTYTLKYCKMNSKIAKGQTEIFKSEDRQDPVSNVCSLPQVIYETGNTRIVIF